MDAPLELWRFQNQRGKARTRDPSCVAKAGESYHRSRVEVGRVARLYSAFRRFPAAALARAERLGQESFARNGQRRLVRGRRCLRLFRQQCAEDLEFSDPNDPLPC
jgi:hypothetical protein